MTLAYVAKLGFITWKTSIGAQKIDSLSLKTHDMATARFLLQDNLERVWFFKETFLLSNIIIKVVLEIFFLVFNNTNF